MTYGRRSVVDSRKSHGSCSVPERDLDELIREFEPRFKTRLICLSRSWGRLEQTVAYAAQELARYGLKTRVAVLRDSPLHLALAEKTGIQCRVLDYRPRNSLDLHFKRDLRQW